MKFQFILPVVVLAFVSVIPTAFAGTTLPVDSPAFVFSPGNWTGDAGRGGKLFRQTWNPGAYFRVTWETTNAAPTATLRFDTAAYPKGFTGPTFAYNIDGIWKSRTAVAGEVNLEPLSGAGKHELTVYVLHPERIEDQTQRWGSAGKSGINVLRVTGLEVDAGSRPVARPPAAKWAMIVGDSITEGTGTSELAGYSFLVGQVLQTLGYEYDINACGWSGWINKGDCPPGDVPGYYVVTHSSNGTGGQYDDAASRWNKIDGNHHSLLDARGHFSAYGPEDEAPSLILINYGTNDGLHHTNPSDTRASITQGLAALRDAAPDAQIIVLIPFGQYYAAELKQAVAARRQLHPADTKISVIDLGPDVAKTLATDGMMGGLHPNDRGHALFAARIIPQMIQVLAAGSK